MKRTLAPLSIALLLFLSYINATAQLGPAIKWQKCLGGTRDEQANDVVATPDGGFIVVGLSKSNDGDVTGHHGAIDTADGWIAKLNSTGSIVWQKSIGGSSIDYFNSIIPTSDGGYLCIGTSNSNDGDVSGNHGKGDYWAVKISNTGTLLWSKCYGGSSGEVLSNGVATYDGGFAIIGDTRSVDGDVSGNTAGNSGDAWLIKLDNAGTLLWQKCYGTFSYGKNPTILEEANHNLLLELHPSSASTDFNTINTFDNSYARVDKDNGNFIRKVTSSMIRFTQGSSVVKTGKGYLSTYTGAAQYPLYSDLVSVAALLDTAVNTITTMTTPWGSASSLVTYKSYFAPSRGLAALSDTSFIGCGMLTDNGTGTGPTGANYGGVDAYIGIGRFIGSSGSSPTYKYYYQKYGGTQADNFTSIKVLASGNDYIAVGTTGSNDVDVSGNHGGSDCWVVYLTGVNSVAGNVFLDMNGNGVQDAGETYFDQVQVKSSKTGLLQSAVPYQGHYQNDVDTGVYITTVIPNKPYYTITPSSKTSTFTTYKNTDTVNFAVRPIPAKRDYAVSALTILPARPGFAMQCEVMYSNNGTDTLVNKSLVFIKDSRSHLTASTRTVTTTSGDTLTWNIASLLPGASGIVVLTLKLDSIPSLKINDTVFFKTYIDSTGDVFSSDNTATLRRIIHSSYDPNDKQESYGGYIAPQDISTGKNLVYTIRFQNTGNDTAFTVTVRDTLDTKVDPATIEMVDASHPYQMNVRDGKYVTWVFNNIKLVDSVHNEPLSHGYLSYRIKPQSTLGMGDTIHNSASIYFDFNPAVTTATQITVVKVSAPAQPTVTGLQSNYCINAGVQKGIIINFPAAGSGITSMVKLNSTPLAVAADSSFSFNTATAGLGNDTITVIYSNASGSATYNYYFTIAAAVTPDVNVSANNTTIVNLVAPVTLTASNASGGGSTPLYTFAGDRAIATILQAEGSSATYSVNTALLPMGDNWLYVRMRTSSTCYTTQTNIDSIKLYKLLIPNQPTVSGAGTGYCSSGAAQKIKITNIPSAVYLATTTVTLDGGTSLTVAADSTFSINPAALATGNHTVIVAFTNASGVNKDTLNFSITQAVTPDVNVSTNISTVVNLTDNVIITASNAAGGGASPLYTFAKDRAITNILQAESAAATLTIAPNALTIGSNWIYVRMKTSSSCYTAQTNIDSIKIDRSTVTGLVDIDNPGQVITVYPNPVVQSITISGLSAAKTYFISINDVNGREVYRQQVGNSTHITINKALLQSGNYWLRVYDVKKNRLIGASLLMKE